MIKRPYIITVKGKIKVQEGIHYAQGWGAAGLASLEKDDEICFEYSESQPFVYNNNSHQIESDLYLNSHSRLTPYAIYCAEGGIAISSGKFCPCADISTCSGYYPAVHYYRANMTEIQQLLNENVDKKVEDGLYRGMYIQIFSVLELFLYDYLLCGIFNVDGCYERAIVELKLKKSRDPQAIEDSLFEKLNKKVFHRFSDIKSLYSKILNKTLPETGQLSKMLYLRHDLVHRYVFTQKNHMEVISVSKSDLIKLISECNKLVERLGI